MTSSVGQLNRSLGLPPTPRKGTGNRELDDYLRAMEAALTANHRRVADRIERMIELDLEGHTHTEDDITDLGDYLPLAAGSGSPLTGDLWIKSDTPTLYLNDDGDALDYSSLKDDAAGLYIAKLSAAGSNAIIYLNPLVDSTETSEVRIFRATNTSGTRALRMYLGDGSATQQHVFDAGTGDVDLCQQGGQLTIRGTGGSESLTVASGNAKVTAGNLYVDGTGAPIIYVRRGGSSADSLQLKHGGSATASLLYVKSSGKPYLDIDAIPSDGSSDADIEFFYNTSTTGTARVLVMAGDGSSTVSHQLIAGGHAVLGAPSSALADGSHQASAVSLYLDESNHRLYFKCKYSDGSTVKSGYIAIA